MALTLIPFVPGESMRDAEDVVEYLRQSFAEDSPEELKQSLGIVARSAGMSDVARRTGLSRESLYRALSPDGNPQLETVMKVLAACGMRLTVEKIPLKKTKKSPSIAPSGNPDRRRKQARREGR